MEISKNTPQKSKIIDPFHGGRNLDAIYAMDDLTGIETAILIFLGGQLNFKNILHSKVTISLNQISESIKFKKTAIKVAIKSLVDKGYLYLENNFDLRGFKTENTYSITDYLFNCYVEKNTMRHVVDSRFPTIDGRETASNLPLFNDPDSEAERSEEEKNEKTKNARVGRSPSPRQKDTRVINFDDSLVSGEKKLSLGGEVKLSLGGETIPNKTPFENEFQAVKSPKIDKPIVTPAHNKMVLLFTPRPELKSFVHRNTILALTDELIGKHGKMAVKAINRLYTDLMKEDLCGSFPWSIKRTMSFFNEALEKLKEDK